MNKNTIGKIANEFGISPEQFMAHFGRSPSLRKLPGQLPNRNFQEGLDRDSGPDRKRIERAANFAGVSPTEFIASSVMEMVRTMEEDMILSPRTGCVIGDWSEVEDDPNISALF